MLRRKTKCSGTPVITDMNEIPHPPPNLTKTSPNDTPPQDSGNTTTTSFQNLKGTTKNSTGYVSNPTTACPLPYWQRSTHLEHHLRTYLVLWGRPHPRTLPDRLPHLAALPT